MATASPTSPAAAALLSDLGRVTVRNTFLEFTPDLGHDDLLPESGFARQASEPAKPFNRQVSEQTTTGSGATLDEGSTEPDENSYTHVASYLGASMPGVGGGGGGHARIGGGCAALPADLAQALIQAFPTGGYSGPAMTNHHVAPEPPVHPVMRFCPNCGAEAEPNHRFCPYCCYQLQTAFSNGGGSSAGAVQQGQGPPQPSRAASSAAPPADAGAAGAPNLLSGLRRFRYVEASPADVGYAHAVCLKLVQAGQA